MDAVIFAAFLSTAAAPVAEFRAFEPEPIQRPLTYQEARQRSLATGLPLVCWVGTGDVICPACVATLKDEAVHHFTATFPDVATSAIVVAVPEGGELLRVADVTQWTTGDKDFGHVGSVRRVLRNWRAKRQVTRGGWAVDTPVPVAVPMMVPWNSKGPQRPLNFAPRPVSFRRGGG